MVEASEVTSEWTLGLRTGNIDICLNGGTSKAIVVYPWFTEQEDLEPILRLVKAMGFVDVTERGNLPGYSIPAVDTTDFDYILVSAANA